MNWILIFVGLENIPIILFMLNDEHLETNFEEISLLSNHDLTSEEKL